MPAMAKVPVPAETVAVTVWPRAEIAGRMSKNTVRRKLNRGGLFRLAAGGLRVLSFERALTPGTINPCFSYHQVRIP